MNCFEVCNTVVDDFLSYSEIVEVIWRIFSIEMQIFLGISTKIYDEK